ncbi:MAG: glycosyltransferase family 2 protein [Campylobacteraceae bacterium]|jgi:glycosyltransferase involved in cell wall biosynthesis|nr:glycosyltransferase family 2 protein [Campylobacteraceae bacterium]
MDRYCAAVVVPTLNNDTIFEVVKSVRDLGYEIVVVDDGSNSLVAAKLETDEKTHIITHPRNLGKGAALKSGANKAKELGYSYFVSMDADRQHLPREICKLTDAINYGDDTIVIGARDFEIDNVPNGSKIGRSISNFWAILDTSCKITDSLSGFRLYPVSILNLPIKSIKFDWEMEVLVKHAWLKKQIVETTVQCYYPKAEERVSHFKKWRDTVSIVWLHIKLLPFRLLLFKGFI